MSGLSATCLTLMDKELAIIIIGLAAGLLMGTGLACLQAANEAAAFNRLITGPKVTVWDALVLDLRVEAR